MTSDLFDATLFRVGPGRVTPLRRRGLKRLDVEITGARLYMAATAVESPKNST